MAKPRFDPVDPRQSFPALEQGILQYWREEDMFRRSIHHRGGAGDDALNNPGGRQGPVNTFSFYDGPPFATGLPHYGHLLAGTIKDVIPRYQTMRGNRVERRFGWDCHGLPIENLVEKEHDIASKREIEEKGVAWFNGLCRGSVQRYVKEWRATVERMGRWVDMDWDYRTMDPDYMESIWWVFAALRRKGLIEEGYKPMHVCPRCVTPLSNFEVTQGYKEVTDMSVIAKFEIRNPKESRIPNPEKTYLLAWTTTPWTLPGNLFLAVNPKVKYVKFKYHNDFFIVAESIWMDRKNPKSMLHPLMYAEIIEPGAEIPEMPDVVDKSFPGKDLVGKKYEPLFPYFAADYPDAFRVVAGDFVTTQDGTGVVHIAPGFGEDDYGVWQREAESGKRPAGRRQKASAVQPDSRSPIPDSRIPLLQHVTMEGRFVDAVTDFAGMEVKPKDDPSKTDKKIAEHLEERGLLFAKAPYRHTYPHCWRCDSPLLNYATSSWFVAVEKIKEDMLAANAETQWVPAHIRDGRFGKWLENARDWAISRNRYWGTPLPLWRCGDAIEVVAGRDELMAKCLMRFTKLTAVRHGESEGNVKPVYQGIPPGTDLTKRGREQAQATGERLSRDPRPVRIVYCSPLARTRQTAQAIADATGAEVIVDERLREVGFGEYEGKTVDFSDLALVRARRAHKLETGQPESIYHFPGMETWDDVQKRVSDFLRDVLPRHRSEHIVVVTHADPLQNFRWFFTGEDPFKLSHQPYPTFATPYAFFYDHATESALDLHKETVDGIAWQGPPSPFSVTATFVRHGETDWNKTKRIQGGNVDEPLNDEGRRQIRAAADALAGQQFDGIICSDLRRAKESAEILSHALGVPIVDAWASLRERNTGTWSGRSFDDIITSLSWVPVNGNVSLHPAMPPEGESLHAYLTRIQDALDDLRARYAGKRVLVISHSGVLQAARALTENLPFAKAPYRFGNGEALTLELHPMMRRTPEVLDCWFESGAMPYAQSNYPYAVDSGQRAAGNADRSLDAFTWEGDVEAERAKRYPLPRGFPADFIAENLDQTRGWFYTLIVLSAALFGKPAFRNCICGGIVLAEDGRKMSKRLKNYPDPNELMEKHGADALRFALMSSPVVRAETLRFSERAVAEAMQNILLPLWNAYSFFVTYANEAGWEPLPSRSHSAHPLDRYIRNEVQDLVNRMTEQLDAYDLSATCAEMHDTIDALTNWYIRLSRRRFAGKGALDEHADVEPTVDDRNAALDTLYDVLLTMSQLLAPLCPFVTESIYLNLVGEEHGSIHLTDWPQTRKLGKDEAALLEKHRMLRRVVSLGLGLRAEKKIKQRQPLAQATIALPPALASRLDPTPADVDVLLQELNVKTVAFADEPGSLGEQILQINARAVGPRLGGKVQDLIAAGKRGEFSVQPDGSFLVLEEAIGADEATVVYRGREGEDVAAAHGIVVSLDTRLTPQLKREGLLRDLIRSIQMLRKDAGLTIADRIILAVDGIELTDAERNVLIQETRSTIGACNASAHSLDLDDRVITIRFSPISRP
ncbi:MAG: isoleucyl-tRNA synthetase [Candidatus Peregrinibacteria bacterium Gr01-1014_25]|nr:MAG: isoleucyl-tRNA synthetase [Candidatus Peregrinibacteria bacterium Gr01-1014_25]